MNASWGAVVCVCAGCCIPTANGWVCADCCIPTANGWVWVSIDARDTDFGGFGSTLCSAGGGTGWGVGCGIGAGAGAGFGFGFVCL